MAWDPRQAPTESYVEFAAVPTDRGSSGRVEAIIGESAQVDLDSVFRFSPEIHAFLQILDRFYPAFELGQDAGVGLDTVRSTRPNGPVPEFFLWKSEAEETQEAINDALSHSSEGERVALLCLDRRAFRQYRDAVGESTSANFKVVESRDDADKLRYSSRSIVLAQPHNVAGLQFQSVVIGGCRGEFSQYDADQEYGLRRFLADLYVGASRAEERLSLHASGERGDFPPVIQVALEEGVLAPRAAAPSRSS